MARLSQSWLNAAKAARAFAILFLLALVSIALTRGPLDVAAGWPVNALALVLLLRRSRRLAARLDLLFVLWLSTFIANLLGDSPPAVAALLSIANVAEVAAAFVLIRRLEYRPDAVDENPDDIAPLRLLIQAGIIAPTIGATVAAISLNALGHADVLYSWMRWWLADCLGMLIVTPLGIHVRGADLARLKTRAGARDAALSLILIAVSCSVVFTRQAWPLLFLIGPAVAFAAFRLRALGAAIAIAVSGSALVFVASQHFPTPVLANPLNVSERIMLAQITVLAQSIVALAIVAALNRRDAVLRVLESQRAQAAADARAKSQLLTNVSHEIRTPLNVIQGYADLLLRMAPLSDRQRAVVDDMNGAAQQLQVLAHDLLDSARAERGALALKPSQIEVGALMHAAVADVRRMPEANKASLRIGAPAALSVWADPLRTRQILTNLLSNAIKNAAAFGPISLRAHRRGDMIRMEVIDTGPGLPPEMRGAAFEPFVATGAVSESSLSGISGSVTDKSVGVGLSLVRLLAEAQGGAVGVSSTPHVETRFWVDLPAEAPPADELAAPDASNDVDPSTIFGGDPAPPPRAGLSRRPGES